MELLRAKRPELHAWTTSMSWSKMDARFVDSIRVQIYDVKVNAAIPWAALQRIGDWIGGDPNPGTAFNVDDQGQVFIRPGYYFYKQVSRAGQPGMAVASVSSSGEDVMLMGRSTSKSTAAVPTSSRCFGPLRNSRMATRPSATSS